MHFAPQFLPVKCNSVTKQEREVCMCKRLSLIGHLFRTLYFEGALYTKHTSPRNGWLW